MEFLTELGEIKDLYYNTQDIKWISKHLADEAKIWCRIVKNQINDLKEFEEKFIEKYWRQHTPENVRDRLEYGRYRPNGGLNMIQYMQRNILKCRQLIPPI